MKITKVKITIDLSNLKGVIKTIEEIEKNHELECGVEFEITDDKNIF